MSTMNVLTTAQAARKLGVCEQRVRKLCAEGRIGQKVADRWIIPADELEQFKRIPRNPGKPAGQ